jgi:antitoxin HicB
LLFIWGYYGFEKGGAFAASDTSWPWIYTAEGWHLLEPSPARGRPLVRLAPLVAAKAEMYRAMRQAGIDGPELARRPGMAAKDVERLFGSHHRTRLEQIEAALAALGRRLVVSVESA